MKTETVEEFLARGGSIKQIAEGDTYKRKTRTKQTKKIDAQAMLDAAVGTSNEKEVIAFLKSQGIEVN